ncbi:hypothetical protein GCM10010967_09000 [Dyadobacter beijingensis]|uniref:Secreted protein (Por secretion system target) n=1 Tax=Dyadobacter beijingensis TaxID=365489 RepID=A0ABQ2HF16_9BACT|nr:T9SS type A sorting domain-containing protein [Dyadobacter beijingensis]GGM79491.1 hypothetical protein GCM10010967_09000 [Dyadobacter beijingensis]
MKNFTFLFTLLLLSLGFAFQANATNDCGCDGNKLTNASFEDGTGGWTKGSNTTFGTDDGYNMCGNKNGLITGAGSIWQEFTTTAGSTVNLKVYGGTHNNQFDHQFKLIFYKSDGTKISEVNVDMNFQVGSGSSLQLYTKSAVAPANTAKVRFQAYSSGNYFKIDGACLTIAPPAPVVNCDCVNSNQYIKNASFENGTNDWSKTGTFGTDDAYNMCGSKNGLITGAGSIWQEFNVVPGAKVDVTAYGGTHNTGATHQFKLTFYDAGGNKINSNEAVVDMNYKVVDSYLKQFSISATAPANTAKVRFTAVSSGDYFKIDAICTTVTNPVPVVDCDCVNNNQYIKNASFENGTNDWASSGNFGVDAAYKMCGSKNGLITGTGSIWQDIALVAGTKVDITAYGGTHNTGVSHQFKLTFYDGAGNKINTNEAVVDMNYKVVDSYLKQFAISATAPAGAVKVRFSAVSSGDYFKIDAICTTLTPPANCVECSGNKLLNPSFENGTTSWSVTGSLSTDQIYAVCGSKGAKLSGAGKFWQDVELTTTTGNQVALKIYAAASALNSQKIQLVFLNEGQTELGQLSTDVTKVLGSNPWGLELYTVAGTVPAGTKYVRVLLSSNGGDFVVDNGCLTFSGPPLPVTLSAFSAKKEGSTAQLAWATTAESNSAYFEVQHSQDGKNWAALAQIEAKGESKELETYTYTHTNPFAVNLYRLKMVDLDETFTFSAIKSLNFDGQEQLNVYPNPTVDRIKVSSNQLVTNVKVYNQAGALVLNATPDSGNEVDLTKLSQGTYFVKVNNGPLMRKILIVR